MKIQSGQDRAYKIVSVIILVILAFLFTFPLYWIVTGAFKNGADINAPKPIWIPTEWVGTNFDKLMKQRSVPLWEVYLPFGSFFNGGKKVLLTAGPEAPAAIRWLINAVLMCVLAMLLTCLTAAMAGYALAKKRFNGRALLFSLIVCAMALPKQVILIPLLKEMSTLRLYDSLWAVIFPTVGWPFGVFLMKQFSESIPGEILEAARIDGANEARTFAPLVVPMVKPGIGALAIFGSYIGKKKRLTGEAVSVLCLDTLVAFIAGLIIFPACFAYGIQPDAGPSLIFITLPNVFNHMAGGRIWGGLFFLFMSFAALSTVIAVFQNIVSFATDLTGCSVKKAVVCNALAMILLSIPCVLGFNMWSGFEPLGPGTNVLDLEDFLVSNNLLPLGSLVYLLFCTTRYGWGFEKFLEEANAGTGMKFPRWTRIYVSYLLPVIILAIFLQGYWAKFAG